MPEQYPQPYPPNFFSRFLGGVDGPAPPPFGSPFQPGDFCIDYVTPALWVCTVGGNEGTWINPGMQAAKVGVNIGHNGIALTDGVDHIIPLNPAGGAIQHNWVNGFTFNGTNDGIVATVQGRYLIAAAMSVQEDATLDLLWKLASTQGHTNGVGWRVAANAAADQITFGFTDVAELNVGDEVQFDVNVNGGNATSGTIVLTVQYQGPATSL